MTHQIQQPAGTDIHKEQSVFISDFDIIVKKYQFFYKI